MWVFHEKQLFPQSAWEQKTHFPGFKKPNEREECDQSSNVTEGNSWYGAKFSSQSCKADLSLSILQALVYPHFLTDVFGIIFLIIKGCE